MIGRNYLLPLWISILGIIASCLGPAPSEQIRLSDEELSFSCNKDSTEVTAKRSFRVEQVKFDDISLVRIHENYDRTKFVFEEQWLRLKIYTHEKRMEVVVQENNSTSSRRAVVYLSNGDAVAQLKITQTPHP